MKEITVLEKYLDFADIFPKKSAKVLFKRTKINEHAIQLQKDKQPLYSSIYSLA